MPSTVLVTGGNRGIGLELCRQLTARGDRVIATCRKSSPEVVSLGVQVHDGVDVTNDAQVNGLARKLAGTRLDLLVLNAGILLKDDLETVDLDTVRQQLEVNAVAPLRVVRALLPNLDRGSKLAIITSLMGSMADNGSGSYYGYRMSKAAVNAAAVSLARDLADRGVAVAVLHPGMVATDMTGRRGVPVAESVAGLIARIDAWTPDRSGTFMHANGQELPW